jgi:4-amino-4-deoxy-L-arabinose transferase-like glycosyltransferase
VISWWRARSFRTKLLLITAVGLVLRVVYVVTLKRDDKLWGDAYAYYWSGRLLAEGHGFIQPLPWLVYHKVVQSPDRPPGYFAVLAFWSLIGLKGVLTQKILSAVFIGSASIYVAGRLGKEVAGERVGVVAALIAAFYPNFWLHDGMLMSESQTILTVTGCVLLAYLYWKRPSWKLAVALGALGGVAALTHPDSILIVAIMGFPLTLLARSEPWRRRVAHLLLIGVAGSLVLAPWVGRNLATFDKPVYLSTGLDVTMAVTNCDETYDGYFKAFWYMPCILETDPPKGDLSVQAEYYRHQAIDYMKDHKGRLPEIFALRVGRTWGLYRPIQQTKLDIIEGHEIWVSRVGLVTYYLLAPAALVGLYLLRRRKVTIIPLLAPMIVVTTSAIMTFGNTRYRAAAEISLVIAASVAFVALADRLRARPAVAPEPEPVADDDGDAVLADVGA